MSDLTERDFIQIEEKAELSLKKVKRAITGQTVSLWDCFNYHLVLAACDFTKKQQAATIKELERKLADAEKQNEWINVEDRLPLDESDNKELVLKDISCLIYANGFVSFGFFACGKQPSYWSRFSADNVTHWKFAPPPQEGK